MRSTAAESALVAAKGLSAEFVMGSGTCFDQAIEFKAFNFSIKFHFGLILDSGLIDKRYQCFMEYCTVFTSNLFNMFGFGATVGLNS